MSGLHFDWEAVADKQVSAVLGRNERRMSDGSLTCDALALVVDGSVVVLTVDRDTDEITVAREPALADRDWLPVAALGDLIGKPLGWCWIGTNCQGYDDSFSIALGDVVPDALQPRLTFLAEASSIACFDLTPRSA